MHRHVHPELWQGILRDEYLGSFLSEGGSFIRFVSPAEAVVRRDLSKFLSELPSSHGVLLTSTDASKVRLHFVQDLFFSVASQVPWRAVARRLLLRLAVESGFSVPPNAGDDSSLVHVLAEANSTSSHAVLLALRPAVDRCLLQDRLLTLEFATAAMNLLLAELLDSGDGATRRNAVVAWLTGVNRSLAPVRSYRIFSPISRANSRGMLQSLSRLLRLAGYSGWLWVIDLARATLGPRADAAVRYNRGSLLDAYEVLRQMVDTIDTFDGLGVVAVVASEFASLEARYGVHIYPALQNRLSDEVRHPRFANPLNAFCSLSYEAAEANR